MDVCALIKLRGGFNPALDAGMPVLAKHLTNISIIGRLFDRIGLPQLVSIW
jgi:hypothetical protein